MGAGKWEQVGSFGPYRAIRKWVELPGVTLYEAEKKNRRCWLQMLNTARLRDPAERQAFERHIQNEASRLKALGFPLGPHGSLEVEAGRRYYWEIAMPDAVWTSPKGDTRFERLSWLVRVVERLQSSPWPGFLGGEASYWLPDPLAPFPLCRPHTLVEPGSLVADFAPEELSMGVLSASGDRYRLGLLLLSPGFRSLELQELGRDLSRPDPRQRPHLETLLSVLHRALGAIELPMEIISLSYEQNQDALEHPWADIEDTLTGSMAPREARRGGLGWLQRFGAGLQKRVWWLLLVSMASVLVWMVHASSHAAEPPIPVPQSELTPRLPK